MSTRSLFVATTAAALLLSGCASSQSLNGTAWKGGNLFDSNVVIRFTSRSDCSIESQLTGFDLCTYRLEGNQAMVAYKGTTYALQLDGNLMVGDLLGAGVRLVKQGSATPITFEKLPKRLNGLKLSLSLDAKGPIPKGAQVSYSPGGMAYLQIIFDQREDEATVDVGSGVWCRTTATIPLHCVTTVGGRAVLASFVSTTSYDTAKAILVEFRNALEF